MKVKKWPVYIWFLDNDLRKSAEYLTDKALLRSIDGCIGALSSTMLYMVGIRSKKFHEYFFDKDHCNDTMSRFFPMWPLKKLPSFASYNRKESKWCRMCKENYDYCKSYLEILLDEIAYRSGSEHESASIIEWIDVDMPKIEIPSAGLDNIYLPWKVIAPKFRRVDVIEGYRLQFMDGFEDNDPFKAYGSCKRDIPDFVLKHFNSTLAFES